jgi:hypothetical protein
MRRTLAFIACFGLLALLFTQTGARPDATADTFPASAAHFGVKFCAPNSAAIGSAHACAPATSGTTALSNPDIVEILDLQIGGGAPASPMPDVYQTRWDSNLGVVGGALTGAIVGELSIEMESNSLGSIDGVTGAPGACGTGSDAGAIASLYAGVLAPTAPPGMASPTQFDGGGSYVQSFDDDDGDLYEWAFGLDADDPGSSGWSFEVPEAQEDGIDLDNDGDFTETVDVPPVGIGPEDLQEQPPNGILDGAERMPDYLPRFFNTYFLNTWLGANATRSYGVLELVPGKENVDVEVVTLDLNSVGGGYVQIMILGSPYEHAFGAQDPIVAYNPAVAAQTLLHCPPVELYHSILGITRNNPNTAPNEGGMVTRIFHGSHSYEASFSSEEDYDEDGEPERLDRCQSNLSFGATDPDADGVSGPCDNNSAFPDNCDAGGAAPLCSLLQTSAEGTASGGLCTTLTEAIGFESPGATAEPSFPWDLDQDVDCDGAHNFDDNCPMRYNPSQRDFDFDGAGNVCDTLSPDGCGPSALPAAYDPCPVASGHDHDHLCVDSIAMGTLETGLPPSPPCGSADSDDDGWHDYEPGHSPPEYDINSDADYDGCSDKAEAQATATGGAQFCEGNPLDSDSDNDGTLDGNEDTNGDVTVDWRNDVVLNFHSASAALNNAGSPDSDGDGCSNRREMLLVDGSGGNRNALNPYDFLDVPTPANGPTGTDGKPTLSLGSARNRAVALTDIGVILAYVGRTSTNAGAAYYNGDLNNDGIPDGRQLDRTAGAGNNETAGNLAIALVDVGIALDHVGDSCTGTP